MSSVDFGGLCLFYLSHAFPAYIAHIDECSAL